MCIHTCHVSNRHRRSLHFLHLCVNADPVLAAGSEVIETLAGSCTTQVHFLPLTIWKETKKRKSPSIYSQFIKFRWGITNLDKSKLLSGKRFWMNATQITFYFLQLLFVMFRIGKFKLFLQADQTKKLFATKNVQKKICCENLNFVATTSCNIQMNTDLF